MVRAELAGIDPEKDVEVTVGSGYLTIRAERHDKTEGKHRTEFRYGSFSRSLPLPGDANADDVKASFDHGILTVSVGLKAEKKGRGQEDRGQAGQVRVHADTTGTGRVLRDAASTVPRAIGHLGTGTGRSAHRCLSGRESLSNGCVRGVTGTSRRRPGWPLLDLGTGNHDALYPARDAGWCVTSVPAAGKNTVSRPSSQRTRYGGAPSARRS